MGYKRPSVNFRNRRRLYDFSIKNKTRFYFLLTWFPPGLEIRENLEKWEGIFQSGKSQGILPKILEKQENLNKKNVFCESQGILHKMLENQWI